MKYIPTEIPDVVEITPKVFGDTRGYFMETFRLVEFQQRCGSCEFVQDNQSLSSKGILRGLHYQTQQAQGKLVRVTKGIVFDVAVDLRQSSPSFGKSVARELSAENKKMLWIPPGFAHGFFVVSAEAEFVYKCTEYYAPEYEQSLLWNDPVLNIDWPLNGNFPQLSEKDRKGSLLKDAPVYK